MRNGFEFHYIMLQTFGRAALQRHRPVLIIQNPQCSSTHQRYAAIGIGRRERSADGVAEEVIDVSERRGGHLAPLLPGDFAGTFQRNAREHNERKQEQCRPTYVSNPQGQEYGVGHKPGHEPRSIAQEGKGGRHTHRAPAAEVREAVRRQDDPLSAPGEDNPVRAASCGPTVVPFLEGAGSLASRTRPLSRGMPSKGAGSAHGRDAPSGAAEPASARRVWGW